MKIKKGCESLIIDKKWNNMKKNKFKTELGNIYINRPISRSSLFVIIVLLLDVVALEYLKMPPFEIGVLLLFLLSIIVTVNILMKIIKFILRKFTKNMLEIKYETKRLEWIYNAFEKVFLIFLPLGLVFIIEAPIILLLPLVVFLILVYMAVKNYIYKTRTLNSRK